MKDVVKTMVEHPFATTFIMVAAGSAAAQMLSSLANGIAVIIHGKKPATITITDTLLKQQKN